MRSFDAKKVRDLIIANRGFDRDNIIAELVKEIIVLDKKIREPEKQSFYFRQGIDNAKEILGDMKKQFSEYREVYNESDVDDLISDLNLVDDKLQLIRDNRERSKFLTSLGINILLEKKILINSMLALKLKLEKLENIDHYLKSNDAASIFFET